MKISFDTNREDMVAFNLHYYDTDPASIKNRRQGRFVIPVMLVLVAVLGYNRSGNWMPFVWFGGIALLWILLHPWWRRSGLNSLIKAEFNNPDNENLFGERTMEFDDEKVTIETDKSYETMQWSIFIRAFETPDHFFLYIAKRQAHVIPKRRLSRAKVDELDSLIAAHIPVYSKTENKKTKQ